MIEAAVHLTFYTVAIFVFTATMIWLYMYLQNEPRYSPKKELPGMLFIVGAVLWVVAICGYFTEAPRMCSQVIQGLLG